MMADELAACPMCGQFYKPCVECGTRASLTDPALIERARKLAYATDFTRDDIGGEFGTCSYRNPDGPEIYEMLTRAPAAKQP